MYRSPMLDGLPSAAVKNEERIETRDGSKTNLSNNSGDVDT